MRVPLLFFVLGFFIAFSCVGDVLAKERKATTRSKSAASSKEKTDNVTLASFDATLEKLPPNFNGTDIAKLFKMLEKKAPLKKDEYETTADYENRIASAATGDIYAFKPVNSGLGGVVIQPYDADNRRLSIEITTSSLSSYAFRNDNRAMLIIKEFDKRSRSYVGSNVFGAKVLVTSLSGKVYGVALTNQTDFGSNKYSPGWRTMPLSIDMSPEKARTLKNNISVLLLCKPTLHESSRAPFSKGNNLIFEGTSYSKATMDSPTSLSYDGKFINVEAVSVWVYETNTGSILLKNDLPDRKAQANPDSGEQNAIDSGRQGIAEKFVGEFVSMNEAAKTLIAKGQTEMTFDVSGLRRMPTLTAGDMVTVVFVEKDGKNIAKAVVRRR